MIYRTKNIILYSLILICLTLVGCSEDSDVDNFIGTWTNQIDGKGDIKLTIYLDGGNIRIKEELMSTGKVMGVRSAKYADGRLLVEGSFFFDKLIYSAAEKMLLPKSKIVANLPGYRRL